MPYNYEVGQRSQDLEPLYYENGLLYITKAPVILNNEIITKDADSYEYLAESIRMHPDQETLKQMMVDAGFEQVDYTNMTDGIVALHRGYKF